MFSTETIDAFTKDHQGPIYWLPECEVMAFIKTKYANASDDWPDIQLLLASYSDNTDGGLFSKRAAGITDDFYTAVYEDIIYRDSMSVVPMLMRARSRGRLLLKDDNIKNHPLIYPNYYSDPRDLQIMVYYNQNIIELKE